MILQDDSSKVPANQVRFCQAEDILPSEEQEGLKLKRVSSSSADAPNQRFKIFKETYEAELRLDEREVEESASNKAVVLG